MLRAQQSLFVRAARGEKVERTPVWAMRQAGRWDPEFRRLRAGHDFYEFNLNPELSAAASLCPLRFGVDAIIQFYDITTLSVAMGQTFRLAPERGPIPDRPIASVDDVLALTTTLDERIVQPIEATLRLICESIPETIPALVFAGAPFTLATYMIGTGKDIARTRTFIREQPTTWQMLLDRIADATVVFLRRLLSAGASAYQLFDSWAGELSEPEYEMFAHAYHERIIRAVDGLSILFVKDLPFLPTAARAGANVISVGTPFEISRAKEAFPSLVFQGNVDHELLVTGTAEDVRQATEACLRAGGGLRHILNLDHGMAKDARPELFEVFIRSAHGR